MASRINRRQFLQLVSAGTAGFLLAPWVRRQVAAADLALARHRAGFSLDRARRLAESAARRYARIGVEAQEARARALAMGCRATLTASALDQAMALADELGHRGEASAENPGVDEAVGGLGCREGDLEPAPEDERRRGAEGASGEGSNPESSTALSSAFSAPRRFIFLKRIGA